jgi:hypothetical protein
MLQVFHLDDICCSGYTRMLQVRFPNVSSISSGCCICCSGYTRMLQVYVPNVSPILDVCASVLSGCCICCNCYTYMLEMYVSIVSPVLVYCSRCSSPRALTRGHVCAACIHPTPISVMRTSFHSRTCMQRAVSTQMGKHSLVKVHVRMKSARAG